MRSPLPILFAVLGLIAAAALLWWSGPRLFDQRSNPELTKVPDASVSEAPLTLVAENADPLARLLPVAAQTFEHKSLAALFASSIGETVTLPSDPPIRGLVNLRKRHASGDLALGIQLSDLEEASAFLSMRPTGAIEGHVVSRRSGTAYRIAIDANTGETQMRRLPATDLLCVSIENGLLVPGLPPEPSEEGEASESEVGESAPLLESRPGSGHVIFLNFDGETVAGTPWNSSYNSGNPIVAAPFGTPAHIPGIWQSISEDYSIFDVNVTTDRADFDAAAVSERVMIIFTPTKAWYGSAGGVAYVNSFGSATNPYAWVFNLTLNGAAESGSHEIGHTLGLRHDGTSSRAYYTGHTHASGVDWGPIMGTSYNRDMVQFSKGEYPKANRTEDDLALITDYLEPIVDDHGNTAATATVVPSASGAISETGIIGNENDFDLFRIETDETGTISVAATPHALYRNLDIGLDLLDVNLAVLFTHAPDGAFDANLTATSRPPGTYFVRVRGTGLGNLTNGYGKYGSIGTYTLTGSFPASPLPDIPTSLSASDGTSTAEVILSWTPSDLAEGYHVFRGTMASAVEASLIASASGPAHADDTAVPGTVYHYFVSAFNGAGESDLSVGDTGFRQLLPPEVPDDVTASTDSPHSIRVSWSLADRARQYRVSRNASNSFSGATEIATTASLSWHDNSTFPGATFYYFVEAINTGGVSAPGATPAAGVKTSLPPGTPSGLSAGDGTFSDRTLLSWTEADGAMGYHVYRNTIETVAGADEIAFVASGTSHLDTSGLAGTVYWYFVRAALVGGESGPSNLDTGFRILVPPSAPFPVTATQGTHPSGVLVSWTTADGALRYFVYRGADSSPNGGILLGETTDLNWLDGTAAPGRTYRYFIRAENTAGLSNFSDSALGYDMAPDPIDDDFENNDDLSTATPLPGGSTVSPEVIAAVAVDGDPDWYAITLGPGEFRLDLALLFDRSDGALVLALYDESGQAVASSSDGVGSQVISHTGTEGASYRVLVERDEGATIPYRLLWSRLAPGDHGLAPDVIIGAWFPPALGEGIRNWSGAGQSFIYRQRNTRPRRAYVDLINRSAVTGEFRTKGSSGNRFVDVDYFRLVDGTWRRITGTMRWDGIGSSLAPFERTRIKLFVRFDSHRSRRVRRAMNVHLVSRVTVDPGVVDRVRLRLVKLPTRRR